MKVNTKQAAGLILAIGPTLAHQTHKSLLKSEELWNPWAFWGVFNSSNHKMYIWECKGNGAYIKPHMILCLILSKDRGKQQ